MFRIYLIIAGMMVIVFLCTIPYKRKLRKKLNKKEHKLWFVYGLAMLLADSIPKKWLYRNSETNRFIQRIYVKENTKPEQYLYVVRKLAISILVVVISLFFAIALSISEGKGERTIQTLKRDSLKDSSYTLLARSGSGKTEEVSINVSKKDMTEKEIREVIIKRQKELVKEFLGKNEDVNHVSDSVNFVSAVGEENIYITWEISDTSVLGYDGQITESATDKGSLIYITAMMTYRKVTVDYTFPICVFKGKKTENIAGKLQQYVDENDTNKQTVSLPKTIDGKSITYFTNKDNTAKWIFPIGMILSIVIFFLKNKDLKKQSEERNNQMENDYPELVSQILLYYGAGMSLKSTIERIRQSYYSKKETDPSYFRYAYEELDITLTKMKSGVSEVVALEQFGNRSGLTCYKRLSGIIEQNVRRGTKELIYALKAELNSAMEQRKNRAMKEGAKMSSKLLGPMILMLIMSMIIIMVPAFMSMSV